LSRKSRGDTGARSRGGNAGANPGARLSDALGCYTGSVDDVTQKELEHLEDSLHGWAFGDIRRAQEGGVKMGVFVLGAQFIDAVARLAYSRTKTNAKAAWDEFVPKYLPRYENLAELMYRGYRGKTSHNYSARGVRFTDGEVNRDRHLRLEEGDVVLHLESFVDDLEVAWDRFYADVRVDEDMRRRVLQRARENPPLGIVGGEPVQASVEVYPGVSISIAGNNPTAFAAPAASAASWPTAVMISPALSDSSREERTAAPKRAIPKSKKKQK
jgi:hypothetical protein